MSKREMVVLREWEYRLYCIWDSTIYFFEDLFYSIYCLYAKAKDRLRFNIEYYLADDGTIKRRRGTGRGGLYIRLEGKLVKVRGATEVEAPDDMTVIPWQECNNGYYDETLETHVESKQHYRRLMKEKGLRPYEKTDYCGSGRYRRQQMMKEAVKKNWKKSERAFIEACKKAEVSLGWNSRVDE